MVSDDRTPLVAVPARPPAQPLALCAHQGVTTEQLSGPACSVAQHGRRSRCLCLNDLPLPLRAATQLRHAAFSLLIARTLPSCLQSFEA